MGKPSPPRSYYVVGILAGLATVVAVIWQIRTSQAVRPAGDVINATASAPGSHAIGKMVNSTYAESQVPSQADARVAPAQEP